MKSLTVGFALMFFGPASAAAQQGTRYEGPNIDMHLHAMPVSYGADGKPIPLDCYPEPCEHAPALASTDQEILDMTLAAMDRNRIVLGFLSGEVERVYTWVAAAPGRFIASTTLWEPGSPDIEFLRGEYRAGRLHGLGEITTQYNGYRPDDPALDPYFAMAEELAIPTHIHTAGFGAHLPDFRVGAGSPVILEEVLVRHPNLRLFVENAGFPFTQEWIAMAYQ